MEKFYIIANNMKDPELETARFVQQYLTEKGKSCMIQEQAQHGSGQAYR